MRYTVSALVRDSPERVWAWWTDYGRPGDRYRVDHGMGWSDRTIVSRRDDVIEMKETVLGVTLLRHRVELHPSQRAFKETARSFTAWWSFERVPEGTLVRREVEVHGRLAKLAPRGLTVLSARKDLEHHARECERAQRG